MLFCPKCKSILRPRDRNGKKVLYCSCGFVKSPEGEESVELKEKIENLKKVEVMDEQAENIQSKIKIKCEKCGNNVAYYWTQQTRSADEPETRFFKCVKCAHTWREYS